MSTERKSGHSMCKPRLEAYYYRKLQAERFKVDKDAGEGTLHASTSFNIADLEAGKLPATCSMELIGKRGEDSEFSIHVELIAHFIVGEDAQQDQCESMESFEFVASQMGPLVVTKGRELMQNLGFNGKGVPFFDPFSDWVPSKK